MVKSSCILPVMSVPPYGSQNIVHSIRQDRSHRGGQITVHFTSQDSTTPWWSNRRTFHQSGQYHTMVVKSSYIPSVRTVPHYGGQIVVHSTSQDSTTLWWSNRRELNQSGQYHPMVVKSSCIPSVKTVPPLSLIHI